MQRAVTRRLRSFVVALAVLLAVGLAPAAGIVGHASAAGTSDDTATVTAVVAAFPDPWDVPSIQSGVTWCRNC